MIQIQCLWITLFVQTIYTKLRYLIAVALPVPEPFLLSDLRGTLSFFWISSIWPQYRIGKSSMILVNQAQWRCKCLYLWFYNPLSSCSSWSMGSSQVSECWFCTFWGFGMFHSTCSLKILTIPAGLPIICSSSIKGFPYRFKSICNHFTWTSRTSATKCFASLPRYSRAQGSSGGLWHPSQHTWDAFEHTGTEG